MTPVCLLPAFPAIGGGGRIRTFEGVSRQIYSLLPLAAWVPLPEKTSRVFSLRPPGVSTGLARLLLWTDAASGAAPGGPAGTFAVTHLYKAAEDAEFPIQRLSGPVSDLRLCFPKQRDTNRPPQVDSLALANPSPRLASARRRGGEVSQLLDR